MKTNGQLFQVEIRVNLYQLGPSGGMTSQGLQLSESVTLKADGFLEVCKILSQFHETAKALEQQHAGADR